MPKLSSQINLPIVATQTDLEQSRVKRANGMQDKLEIATENGNYHYLLKDRDLADIARLEYNNFKGFDSLNCGYEFRIVNNINFLKQELESFQRILPSHRDSQLTLLINLGNLHWTTLVLSYTANTFHGYYADSKGNLLSNEHPEIFLNAGLKDRISDFSEQISQQQDDYNSGIWALENANDFNRMLQQGQTVTWVLTQLKRKRNSVYFQQRRDHLASLLRTDPARIATLHASSDRAEYIANRLSNLNIVAMDEKKLEIISAENSNLSEEKRLAFFTVIREGDLPALKEHLKEAYDQETLDEFLLLGNEEHKTALHIAAEEGNSEIVDYLISRGAHPDLKDPKGKTPLIYAVKNQHSAVIISLLAHKADINTQDKKGMTPVHHAVKAGHLAMVQLLIEKGANYKIKAQKEMTPLILAAKHRHATIIQLLIETNERNWLYINQSDEDGMAILHHLAKEKEWDLLKYVLTKGGSVNQLTKKGKLPITWVLDANKHDIAACMLTNGLNINYLTAEQQNKLLSGVIQLDINNIHAIQHNLYDVLYNTMRLNNIELLKALLEHLKISNGDRSADLMQLVDELLPKVYQELQIKNVQFSYPMSYYIENKIIQSHIFIDNTPENKKEVKQPLMDVMERIDTVTHLITELQSGDTDTSKIDAEFILNAQFIAQNIHSLKRQLRSTYHRLPWEEIEFCLVNFIYTHKNQQQADFISELVLNKEKLLEHLRNFAAQLELEKPTITEKKLYNDFPKQADPNESARKEAMLAVISNNPLFETLYDDHDKIRTLYSLKRMESYLESALSDDLKDNPELAKLVLERTLQVIGENLKHTMQSPNVSEDVHQWLIYLAPKYLRELLTSLRDSLSHQYLLKNKMTLEYEQGPHFFNRIQTDLKKIYLAIGDMLYRKKMNVIHNFFLKILHTEDLNEIKKLIKNLSKPEMESIEFEKYTINILEKTKQLIDILSDEIPDLTEYEKKSFERVKTIINLNENKVVDSKHKYVTAFGLLSEIVNNLNDTKSLKHFKAKIEKYFNKSITKLEPNTLESIRHSILVIHASLKKRLAPEILNKFDEIFYKISYNLNYELDHINHISNYKSLLEKKENDVINQSQQILEAIFLQIKEKLSDADKSSFENEIKKQKNSYDEKLKLLNFFSFLADQSTNVVDPLIQKEYQDLTKSLRKSLKTKLEKIFKAADWQGCKLIIEKLQNSYQKLLESTINSITNDETIKIYKHIKDFFNAFDNKILKKTISELTDQTLHENKKSILNKFFNMRLDILDNFAFYDIHAMELNTELKIAMESITLDLLELLESHSLLSDNRYFIDTDSPFLVGKSLRNYLAHGDIFFDILPANPAIALMSNLFALLEKDIALFENDKVLVGQRVVSHFANLKTIYDINLKSITNQKTFFLAAKQDNLQTITDFYNQNLVDVNTKLLNGWTLLHFAAQADSINVFKFALDKNLDIDLKCNDRQSSLDIAVSSGSHKIINYLIKEKKLNLFKINIEKLLHLAAYHGQIDMVTLLINHGAQVNERNIYQETSLHFAAEKGYTAVVDILLSNEAKIDALNANNVSPLHVAAKNAHLNVVMLLLNHHATVDALSMSNETPLHFAAENGHTAVVKVLLDYHAKTDLVDTKNIAPLHYAAQNGHYEIVELLLKQRANADILNFNDASPIHLAIENGHIKVVELLLDHHAQIIRNKQKISPLDKAVIFGHNDIVKLLLARNFYFDASLSKGMTPLHFASFHGYSEIITTLLLDYKEKNPEKLLNFINALNVNNFSALYLAAQNGHVAVLNLLLAEGAEIDVLNEQLVTPLHLAATHAETNVILALLTHVKKNHAEKDFITFINAQDINYQSALHIATLYGHKENIKLLLAEGASLNLVDHLGRSPLILATIHSNTDVTIPLLKFIKEKSPEKLVSFINLTDSKGMGALHYAALYGNVKIVELLLTEGALVDGSVVNHMTPLMHAVSNGHNEVVQVLLDRGARIDVETEDMNALFFAARSGDIEVVEALLNYVTEKMPTQLQTFINNPNRQGLTALHVASVNGQVQTVASLLAAGAEVNLKDNYEHPPLYLAAKNGQAKVATLLLKHGANVNVADSHKQTPLLAAARYGYIRTVEILLKSDANVYSQDENKMTALHFAAQKGYVDTVKLLLKYHALKNSRNIKNETPWDLAMHELDIKNGYQPNIEKILMLLSSATSKIETITQQQHAYLTTSTFVLQRFPHVKINAVRQGLYFPSFEQRGLKIKGQCAAITRAFSQSLFSIPNHPGQENLYQSFLANLQTSSTLYERIALGKSISLREEREIFALSRLLDNFRETIDSPNNSLPSKLSPIQTYKTSENLANYLKEATAGDFALHLVTSNHVIAIYRKADDYAYFDSNFAYVAGLKSVDDLMVVLNQAITATGYEIGEQGFLVEHFQVDAANYYLPSEQKETLTRVIRTERSLLAQQDRTFGLLSLNGQTISRVQLYDFGTKIQFEGRTAQLIDAAMNLNQEKFSAYYSANKISMTASDYVSHLTTKDLKQVIQTTQSMPMVGTKRELKQIAQFHQLVSENDQLTASDLSLLVKIIRGEGLQDLSYYIENAQNKKWPNQLTNAAGRISLLHSLYSIYKSLGDEKAFGLGVGELLFSLMSQLIEEGLLELTAPFISRFKFGSLLMKGFAGLLTSGFDFHELIEASIDLSMAVKGSKQWRDSIARIVFATNSIIASAGFTLLSKPGVATVVGLFLIAAQASYNGASMVEEYKKYNLTPDQYVRLFFHTLALQHPPEDVQIKEFRYNQINQIAEFVREEFERSNSTISAYATGLGELSFKKIIPHRTRHRRNRGNGINLDHFKPDPIEAVIAPADSKIDMGRLAPENYRFFVSSIVPEPILKDTAVSVVCPPHTTSESYEFDNTWGRGWPLHGVTPIEVYDCRKAIAFEKAGSEKKNMFFDLQLFDKGLVIARNDGWQNQIMVGSGNNQILGGENALNLFVLNDKKFGSICGGKNSTNILDLTLLSDAAIEIKTPLPTMNQETIREQGNTLALKRESAIYEIDTFKLKSGITINSPNQHATFYVIASAGYSRLIVASGIIVFPEAVLLKEYHFKYFPEDNCLQLKQDDFFLIIENYFNKTQPISNFKLIDRHGSEIQPFIDPTQNETQTITSFSLKAQTSTQMTLSASKTIQNWYNDIGQAKSNYHVFGSVVSTATNTINLFGTSQSDLLPLSKETPYAEGREGSDLYYISKTDDPITALIDNYASDHAMDLLHIPLMINEVHVYKTAQDLQLIGSDRQLKIRIKDYFNSSHSQHLSIMDINKDVFIPVINDYNGLISLILFFTITKQKKFFSLSAEQVAKNLNFIFETNLADVKFYRESNHLLLIGNDSLVLKLENFYEQHGQFIIDFWDADDHQQKQRLRPTQLEELAKLAIDFDDYQKSIFDNYVVEYKVGLFNNPLYHNQAKIQGHLTTLSTKRTGIVIFPNFDKIIVAANENDLILSVDGSDITLKNWHVVDHRVSVLQFSDNQNSLKIPLVDSFDLSQVAELQALVNKVELFNLANLRLASFKQEVINNIKFKLITEGIENNYLSYHYLGFDSAAEEQVFLALHLHSQKDPHHLRHSHAANVLVWLFIRGYAAFLCQNPKNDLEKANQLQELSNCFKTMIDPELTLQLVNYLEEHTSENLDYVERNVKHFIHHHHHEIKNKLSAKMAQSSTMAPEIAPHRFRRNVFFEAKPVTSSAASIVNPISGALSSLKAKTNAIFFGSTAAEGNFNSNYQSDTSAEGYFNSLRFLAHCFGFKSFGERINTAAAALASKNSVLSPINLISEEFKTALESNAALYAGKKFKATIKKEVDQLNTFKSRGIMTQKLKGKRNNAQFFPLPSGQQLPSNDSPRTISEVKTTLFSLE